MVVVALVALLVVTRSGTVKRLGGHQDVFIVAAVDVWSMVIVFAVDVVQGLNQLEVLLLLLTAGSGLDASGHGRQL